MSVRSRLASFVRNLCFSGRVERDLDEELRAYVEMVSEEKRRAGLTETEARRATLIELGGIEQIKESVRDARAGALTDQLRQDVSYALRMFARNRGFTAVAVATLALGIGANTAIFTVVDAVVFRPLPYQDPASLVKIWRTDSREPIDNVSWADLEDMRAQPEIFDEVAGDDGSGFDVTYQDGSREPVLAAFVTANWLPALGVQPVLGRAFLPEEAEPGRDRVAILSHAYWQRRFGADPNVLGDMLTLDGVPFTIVGVLPANVLRYGADVLKPLVPAEYPRERSHRDLDVFARLQAGVTIAQAQAALDTIAARIARESPDTTSPRGFGMEPLGKYYASVAGHAGRGLLLMLAAVGLVLLIACANVTNLLLGRAVARARECLVRAALGASRGRLVRQMLVETALLFGAGAVLGLLLARWIVDSLLAFAIAGGYVPERLAVAIDGRVLAFTVIVTFVAGVLSGLVPALHASRVDFNETLRASGAASSGGVGRTRASRLLIVSEIAIAVVLLVGSGLMIRSFHRLQGTPLGINPENLLQTASDGGREFASAVVYWRAALERARQFPGVEVAAVTSRPPVHGARQQSFDVDGSGGAGANDEARAGDILISPDYFRTVGIPLLEGRAFSEQDSASAPPVAIVSQTLARRYFPDANPIGRRIRINERAPMTCCSSGRPVESVWREIVGVVADVRQANLEEDPAATIYRPYSQIVEHDMFLMVRASSSADVTRIAAQLRQHLLAMDTARVWADVRPMQDVIDGSESLRLRRFVMTLLACFAGLALVLAAVGTYGVMAYAVTERTKEIGIRVALGATRPSVLRGVVAEALKLTLVGLLLGAIAAQLLTRFIATLLFGVSPTDALTYVAVSVVLAMVAVLASGVPARRALRVDPLTALRHE